MLLGSVLAYAAFSFLISFIFFGLCWLIGWRKYPTWRARFWWVTFALAGVYATGAAIGTPTAQHMSMNIAGIILFIIALIFKKS